MKHKSELLKICILIFLISGMLSIEPTAGASWPTQITRLTTAPQFDREPSITQTKDGTIWIVWLRNMYGNDTILCRSSSDFGETWSTEKNLTALNDSSGKSGPIIFQPASDAIWLVWASDKPIPSPPQPHFTMDATPKSLTIQQGNDDTTTIIVTSVNDFCEPVNLFVVHQAPGVTTTLDPATVTPPPNGTATSTLTVSVNATATPGNHTLTAVGTSRSHSDNVEIDLEITESSTSAHTSRTSQRSFSPSSAPDGGDYEIFYRISTDYGGNWSNEIPLTDNNFNDKSPSLLQAQNGTIWLVWVSDQTGNTDIFYKTTSDGGTTWSNNTQLTTDSGGDNAPSITQTRDGRIWIIWSSNRLGDCDLWYNIYDGSWSGDTRLPTDTDIDTSPAILQTKEKKIWVFWSKCGTSPSATNDIYYKCSRDNGANWSESTQFTTDSEEDMWPAITQANDYTMWVIWISNRGDQPEGNFDVYYRKSLVGDVNEDGVVSIMDLAMVSQAFAAMEGDPKYDMDLDLNGDGIIDIRDLSIIGRNYGATA